MTGEADQLAPIKVSGIRLHHLTAAARSVNRHAKKARRNIRRILLRSVLATTVRLRRVKVRVRIRLAGPRLKWIVMGLCATILSAVGIAYLRHVSWHADSQKLVANGTLPQLEIAVGAAMLGVIGIVFSLSIFSIQQVAERGTAYTVREYARDWVFRMVYWALATFAFVAMLSALQEKEAGTMDSG